MKLPNIFTEVTVKLMMKITRIHVPTQPLNVWMTALQNSNKRLKVEISLRNLYVRVKMKHSLIKKITNAVIHAK